MFYSQQLYAYLLILLSTSSLATFYYPDAQISLIEHILVDTHGAHSSGFADAITPCTNYVSGAQTVGRTTAAQWLRVAFHDFVTANVSAGTGGVDASIGFETLRTEDSGTAFNDSLRFFRPFVNEHVSMADLISLSVSMVRFLRASSRSHERWLKCFRVLATAEVPAEEAELMLPKQDPSVSPLPTQISQPHCSTLPPPASIKLIRSS